MRRLATLALAVMFGAIAGLPAAAGGFDPAQFALRPHPGKRLPLTTELYGESGRPVPLLDFFAGKPVIVVLHYLRCQTLCGVTLHNLFATLARIPLDAGRDFEVLAISIDPRDTPAAAAAAKAKYLAVYDRSGGNEGVHFLTGPESAVRPIAEAIGFPYQYDATLDQYIHPAGFIIATPGGRISSYIEGISATPAQMITALGGAARGQALSPLTRLILLCCVEGQRLGRFTVPVIAAFTVANLAAAGAVFAVFVAIRRRRAG
jgi:protein SCO1